MSVQNLYPEQLDAISKFLGVLNQFDQTSEIYIGNNLPILDESGTCLLGYAVDEIGGAWSFRAALPPRNQRHTTMSTKICPPVDL